MMSRPKQGDPGYYVWDSGHTTVIKSTLRTRLRCLWASRWKARWYYHRLKKRLFPPPPVELTGEYMPGCWACMVAKRGRGGVCVVHGVKHSSV